MFASRQGAEIIVQGILRKYLTIQHALCSQKKLERSKRTWMDSEAATRERPARPVASVGRR